MQIGMIGLNHKQAHIELRELVAKTCQRRFGPENSIHTKAPCILLNTCNRTEIYFSSFDLAETQSYILHILKNDLPNDVGQEFYSFFGIDCFHHLAKVTSGFDSAILAETEIQGQVKTAYQQSHQWMSLPFELHYLFQKALKVGKEIRTNLVLPKVIQSIEHAIYHFGATLSNPSLLLIGASQINLKIASFLKNKSLQISLTNRTDSAALKHCENEGYIFLPWSEKETWGNFDWVIAATKAQTPQVHLPLLPIQTKLLIDLGVPRNVDPRLKEYTNLINIDQVNQLLNTQTTRLEEKLSEVESLLEENALKYFNLFNAKSEKLYTFA